MKIHVLALVVATAVTAPRIARAEPSQPIIPPSVPMDLQLSPDEFTPFLMAHAVGTQGYVCVAVGGVYGFVPFGPQATLFDEADGQVMTHFLSPTPVEQVLSPTWQHSRDTSAVWGQVLKISTDSSFVAPGAIAWLLLEAAAVDNGPTGGDKLILTKRIQRVNTVGGKAPTTGCAVPDDIGDRALVPYEADYYFYKETTGKPARE